MLLYQFVGKEVKIKCDDGKIFLGKVIDHIDAEDNEPEGESIVLRIANLEGVLIEFRLEEIKKIEELG